MKQIFIVLLMLFAHPLFAQKNQFVKGHFVGVSSPYVVYYTYSDLENKVNDVWLWNTLTNHTDSLYAIEAKIVDNALYYCDCKTIKKRNFSSESVNGDSVIYSSPFEIENFYIDNGNLLVTEIDSSCEKVNIKYYVDGICSFCESVPCIPQELEYQIVQIFPLEDCFAITVQGDLYIFDKKKKEINKIIESKDALIDETGNIYYVTSSEDYSTDFLNVVNIKDLDNKSVIAKSVNFIQLYSYLINDVEKCYGIIDGNLFRLKNRELNPVKSVKFSEKNTYTVIINPKEEYFVLDY
ncbi:MAG: hypothetical protein IKX93_03720 [Bacteroidaceae bacterium]|nr:hypothetical protein [Bacteroidaceae bacterium]